MGVVIPFEELDTLKNQKATTSCVEEELDVEFETEQRSSFCRTLFTVIMILVVGWFFGTVLIAFFGIAYDPTPVSVFVEVADVKIGQEQVVVEMIPEELQVIVVNMTAGAEIPEDVTAAFFSCMHAVSPNVVGCVSQYYIPSFDECLALSTEDVSGSDLSSPRAMATCGAATISRGEFSLCSVEEPVYLSIWNLEDKHRAVELTFSYDACQECNEIEGNCVLAGYFWESIFLMYTLALFVCCCCVGCVCGCASSSDSQEEEEEELENF